MAERLAFLEGPLTGTDRALGRWHRIAIGRNPANDVVLDDPTVAAYHCTIERKGLLFLLTDLEGSSGTSVNEKPVSTKYLLPGDVLGIGRCRVRFDFEDDTDATRTSVALGGARDAPVGDGLETARRVERRLGSRVLNLAGVESGEGARALLLCAKVAHLALTEGDRAALFRDAMAAVRERLPADRVAIVAVGLDGRLAPSAVLRGADDPPGTKLAVDPVAIGRAARDGMSTAGAREGRAFAAVPLPGRGTGHGALYAEAAAGRPGYSDPDLHLLGTVGRQLGLALDRAELAERAEAATREARLQETRLREILDAVGDVILTIDVAGVIALQNAVSRALLGEAVGRRLVECVPEADQPALGDAVATARAGRAAELKLRLRTPGGVPKKLAGRILPLLRADRTLEALLLVARE